MTTEKLVAAKVEAMWEFLTAYRDRKCTFRERPIIFSSPMVRALLDGRKTQTRRIIDFDQPNCWEPAAQDAGDLAVWHFRQRSSPTTIILKKCRFGGPGAQLWVREAFGLVQPTHATPDGRNYDPFPAYRADAEVPSWSEGVFEFGGWKPSIHMPRWASRITLEITDVRVGNNVLDGPGSENPQILPISSIGT